MAITIALTLDGRTYSGQGETIEEALRNLERPAKLMVKAVITVTDGERSTTRTLTPHQLKMFFRPVAIKYQAKNLSMTLK